MKERENKYGWMGYQEYPDIEHVYVLHHTEGISVQGNDDYEVKEIMTSSNDPEALIALGKLTYPRPTTWEFDGWTIRINTCTVEGKRLYEEMSENNRQHFEALYSDMALHPEDYTVTQYGDNRIIMRKHPAFEDLSGPAELPKMAFMLPSQGIDGKNDEVKFIPAAFWKPLNADE